jgi:prevent-host-death family protein
MRQVDISEAKTHLSQLVEDVAQGDEIVIAKAGKPMARLVGLSPVRQHRRPGLLKGQISIATDFDAPLPAEVLADFEGDP